MSKPQTVEQQAAANYRLEKCRALKRGLPVPNRETHIREYLARHNGGGQDQLGGAITTKDGSSQAPAPESGLVGHSGVDMPCVAKPVSETPPVSTLELLAETLANVKRITVTADLNDLSGEDILAVRAIGHESSALLKAWAETVRERGDDY